MSRNRLRKVLSTEINHQIQKYTSGADQSKKPSKIEFLSEMPKKKYTDSESEHEHPKKMTRQEYEDRRKQDLLRRQQDDSRRRRQDDERPRRQDDERPRRQDDERPRRQQEKKVEIEDEDQNQDEEKIIDHDEEKIRQEEEKMRQQEEQRKQEEEQRRKQEEERRQQEEEKRRQLEEERRQQEEEQRRKEEEQRRKQEEEQQRRKEEENQRRRQESDRSESESESEEEKEERKRGHQSDEEEDSKMISNPFDNFTRTSFLKLIKNAGAESIASPVVDTIRDISLDFLNYMFDMLTESKTSIESGDIKHYMELYLEDFNELPETLYLNPQMFEKCISEICNQRKIKVKRDAVAITQEFLECVLTKIIKGAVLIAENSRRRRVSDSEVEISYQIYMM